VGKPAIHHKMMGPRYREIKQEQIPQVSTGKGILIRVISGEVEGIKGPVKDLVIDTEYLELQWHPIQNSNTESRKDTKLLLM